MFREIRITADLTLGKLVRLAHRAAIDLEKDTFFIITQKANVQKIFEFETKSTAKDILVRLTSLGLTFESIVYLDIEEQYYDLYRCRLLFDAKDKELIIRGRSDFVDGVLEATVSP